MKKIYKLIDAALKASKAGDENLAHLLLDHAYSKLKKRIFVNGREGEKKK